VENQKNRNGPIAEKANIISRHAGVDWLTITTSDHTRRTSVLKRFLRLKEAFLLMGELPKDWGMRGYRGISIGSARWGTREDGDILILSGKDALTFWRIFAPLGENCSRIDLAVTVQLDTPQPNMLREYCDWLRDYGSRTARHTTSLERVDGIGASLYVNRRASDQMGRVYDKGAEMKDALMTHRLWRYELELKSKRAQKALGQLLDAGDALPSCIVQTVWQWFNDRDIPPAFDRRTRDGWEIRTDVSAQVTSSSQQLNWLSSQVKPTVARLCKAGLEAEVIHALGLD